MPHQNSPQFNYCGPGHHAAASPASVNGRQQIDWLYYSSCSENGRGYRLTPKELTLTWALPDSTSQGLAENIGRCWVKDGFSTTIRNVDALTHVGTEIERIGHCDALALNPQQDLVRGAIAALYAARLLDLDDTRDLQHALERAVYIRRERLGLNHAAADPVGQSFAQATADACDHRRTLACSMLDSYLQSIRDAADLDDASRANAAAVAVASTLEQLGIIPPETASETRRTASRETIRRMQRLGRAAGTPSAAAPAGAAQGQISCSTHLRDPAASVRLEAAVMGPDATPKRVRFVLRRNSFGVHWADEQGAYAPAPVNGYYKSAIQRVDASGGVRLEETGEFGFQISPVGGLVVGDWIDVDITPAAQEGAPC